jgi:hypothetical protein
MSRKHPFAPRAGLAQIAPFRLDRTRTLYYCHPGGARLELDRRQPPAAFLE